VKTSRLRRRSGSEVCVALAGAASRQPGDESVRAAAGAIGLSNEREFEKTHPRVMQLT
jgi:hypothetical protein